MSAVAADLGLKNHTKKYVKYYQYGLLMPEHHRRLVEDLEGVSAQSKIPSLYIYKKSKDEISSSVLQNYLTGYRRLSKEGIYGALFTGKMPVDNDFRCAAGVLIRNFIDARVFSVQEILEQLKSGVEPRGSCIFVPNFYLKKDEGGDIPSWQSQALLGWMYKRLSSEKQTVIYASSKASLEQGYGSAFINLITQYYQV